MILPKYIDPNGREWAPYDVQYETSDGTFSVVIHALSFLHAEEMLADLKAYGKVTGEILSVEPKR